MSTLRIIEYNYLDPTLNDGTLYPSMKAAIKTRQEKTILRFTYLNITFWLHKTALSP